MHSDVSVASGLFQYMCGGGGGGKQLNHWKYIKTQTTRLRRLLKHLLMLGRTQERAHRTNIGLMLGKRLRRWRNSKPALFQRVC